MTYSARKQDLMGDSAEAEFSLEDSRALRDIAGTMIPEAPALGMPGADDPAILADIVSSLGRDRPLVREALAAIATRSGGGFAGLDRTAREALINAYHATGGAAAATLGRVVLAAYYRDDRVLRAIGHEARAPFPMGYVVEQGDWSLLDAVRGRAPFWRDDRTVSGGER